jgi:RNA polymerase sigma-70 factor (ECF subfamily)
VTTEEILAVTEHGESGDDPADLAGMFARHGRSLLRYCACRVGPEAAEDVVAETFLVAHAQRHRFSSNSPERSALPWLYGIATNIGRRYRRTEIRNYRVQARAAVADVDGALADAAASRADAAAARGRIAAALAGLPRRQRDVLLLFAVAQLEYAEIAAALEIPLGSVQSALHRARTKLRAALGAEAHMEAET